MANSEKQSYTSVKGNADSFSEKELAPWELGEQNVGLYLLYDRARDLYINPLPIDTEEHAKSLFGQLLETDGTYAYKGYRRFDLYRLCTYKMQTGRVTQKDHRPRFVKSGMDFYRSPEAEFRNMKK